MINEITHISIVVNNLEKSVEFYKNVLEFKLIETFALNKDVAFNLFNVKNSNLKVAYMLGNEHILTPPLQIVEISNNSDNSNYCLYSTSLALCFHVENLDLVCSKLKEKDIDFLSKPQLLDFSKEFFGKRKTISFYDPDKNIIQLTEYIK